MPKFLTSRRFFNFNQNLLIFWEIISISTDIERIPRRSDRNLEMFLTIRYRNTLQEKNKLKFPLFVPSDQYLPGELLAGGGGAGCLGGSARRGRSRRGDSTRGGLLSI